MLVYADRANVNISDNTEIKCTNFFMDNKLLFQANNTVILNIWTNLGKPMFTSGAWNIENYTVTLSLDNGSIGELDWNSIIPLSASDLSTSTSNAGNITVFSALWSDNRSLSVRLYLQHK